MVLALAGAGVGATGAGAQVPSLPPPPVVIVPPLPQQNPDDKSMPGTPAGNPGRWATNDDYPASAMREEREGTTGFRLTYDSNGLPTECRIMASSGHADLDTTTCRLVMARARFTPGRDAQGRAVGGTYANRIRWQIPDVANHFADKGGVGFHNMIMANLPRPAFPTAAIMDLDPADHYPASARAAREEGIVQTTLTLDAKGAVTECIVKGSSRSDALDAATCALMIREGKFTPALDSDGNPTGGRATIEFQWKLPPGTVPDETELADALGELPRRTRPFPMGEPGSATLSILINADGSVGDCKFSGTGQLGVSMPGITPCDIFGGDNVYQPFVDADGKPVARRFILRTDLAVEEAPAAAAPPAE